MARPAVILVGADKGGVGKTTVSRTLLDYFASRKITARAFLVKNFINNTTFFDWDEGTYNSYFNKIPHAVEVVVPKLSEMACEKVELSAVPFATFIADKTASGQPAGYSFTLRGYVRHWLNGVFADYDRVRLTEDRKSTRLNSSHANISYAVFCLKKKKQVHCSRSTNPSHYVRLRAHQS